MGSFFGDDFPTYGLVSVKMVSLKILLRGKESIIWCESGKYVLVFIAEAFHRI